MHHSRTTHDPRRLLAFAFALVPLALAASLASSCTTPGPAEGRSGVAAAAGTWRFSHTGPPSVWKEGLDDPTDFVRERMKDVVIEIEADGSASMLAMGQAGSFRVAAKDENDLAITLAAEGGEGAEAQTQAWTYDKRKRLLIVPIELDVDGSEGTLPAYFKRR